MKSFHLLLLFCLLPVDCSRTPSRLLKQPHLHKHSHPQKHGHTTKRSQPKKMRSHKSVADTGCIPTDGTAYTGNASTTESGLTCQMWSVNTPHEHSYTDVGEHNYCRDPFGELKAWCLTTDPGTRWEWCDVPVCSITYTKGIYIKIIR